MAAIIEKISRKSRDFWRYVSHDVWADLRNVWWVNTVKVVNITVRSFFNSDLQSQACALTYRTMLAVVPALALLFAIGRGFGFQTLITDELYQMFPAQHDIIDKAMGFVDSYLNQASEGIFVGIGILFLLWTLISLVSSVEASFNMIWSIKQGRSFIRQITDYTAMFLILPVLMICGSGLAIMVSSTLQSVFDFDFMSPIISMGLEFASWVFTWLFFTAAFMLIPNTKVRFKNAFLAGVITGSAFLLLQWLFVTGQLYVSKYNAIYGSFSFLPLFLIWLQLVWVICLSGALICYASQNFMQYSFDDEVNTISSSYKEKVTIAIAAIIVQRFTDEQPPITEKQIITDYNIPPRLVSEICTRLAEAGVISRVIINGRKEIFGLQPAIDPDNLTVKSLRLRMKSLGNQDFIPDFDENFPGVVNTLDEITALVTNHTKDIKLSQIKIREINENQQP